MMTNEETTGLLVAGLEKEFAAPGGNLKVLNGIDFSLAPGQSLVVSGPSGSGKSTLLNLLGTLDIPTAGHFTLGGVEPSRLPANELAIFRGQKIGFVFQDHFLLPQLTALENVLVAALALGPVGDEQKERAIDLFERLGMTDRMAHLPGELSGGQRQRVALARALINQPILVLADEPTGNLDGHTAGSIGSLLVEIMAGQQVMLVLATHDQELADRFGDQRLLRAGRLINA